MNNVSEIDTYDTGRFYGSCASLMKAISHLGDQYGISPKGDGPLQERLMDLVKGIAEDVAREGFGQGFFRGGEAGVKGALPDGHFEDIRVEPTQDEYYIHIDGIGTVNCRARRRIVQGD